MIDKCYKFKHATYSAAKKAADRTHLLRLKGKRFDLRVYKCPFKECGGWHVTKLKTKSLSLVKRDNEKGKIR